MGMTAAAAAKILDRRRFLELMDIQIDLEFEKQEQDLDEQEQQQEQDISG